MKTLNIKLFALLIIATIIVTIAMIRLKNYKDEAIIIMDISMLYTTQQLNEITEQETIHDGPVDTICEPGKYYSVHYRKANQIFVYNCFNGKPEIYYLGSLKK